MINRRFFISNCILVICALNSPGEGSEKTFLDFNTCDVANSQLNTLGTPNMELMIDLENEIIKLEKLESALKNAASLYEKRQILNDCPEVREYLQKAPWFQSILDRLQLDEEVAIKQFLALGEGTVAFPENPDASFSDENLRKFLDTLVEVDTFYNTMGGIIGYHLAVIRLLREKAAAEVPEEIHYLHPEGMNIAHLNNEVRRAVRWGLEAMPTLCEIYPVGGAGDRLRLIDEATGNPLPAAQLPFCGRTLLEALIRDLQGREYLYYKLFGSQMTTPIALMTSHEKNNHNHITDICQRNNWFGRSPESFIFFTQPLVPVITKEGDWSFSEPLKLNLKPGGHGIMWKLALDNGVFDYFHKHYRTKALVRQINNPVAGNDYGLIAFAGIGCRGDKAFGFASCPRRLGSPEGTNVLIEKTTKEGSEYTLTNIEYTDFAQKGLQDVPVVQGSPYSAFPSNTNILFADLNTVGKIAKQSPIPGLIINMKTQFPSLDRNGNQRLIEAGRLESTMQNIADYIQDRTTFPLEEGARGDLKTFITFNTRRKTISVTKTGYVEGRDFNGTPEGCYHESLENCYELLSDHCHMNIPTVPEQAEFLKKGPSFVFLYHPALGPIYEVIGQKIRGGRVAPGAEMQLEIAELELDRVEVEGSLLIEANTIVGSGDQNGKCSLKNVRVSNQGVDHAQVKCYWKNNLPRKEALTIRIEGSGEFYAEDILFTGPWDITVPDGHKVTAQEINGTVKLVTERIVQPTWHWNYSFDEQNRIVLHRQSLLPANR